MGKMMFDFFEAWSWVLSLGATGLAGWIWWSIKASFATREDLSKVEDSISTMETELSQRMTRLEGSMEAMPTRGDIDGLRAQLTGITASTARVEGAMEQVQRFVELLTQAGLAKDGK